MQGRCSSVVERPWRKVTGSALPLGGGSDFCRAVVAQLVERPWRKVTGSALPVGGGSEFCRAVVAQLVERVLGKDEVTSSILVNGSSVLKYFVYVLRSVSSRKHYIGIAADVERRLDEHNTKSGRWTSSFKPWELVAREEHPHRRSAAQRERFLKSRAGIEALKEFYGEGKI